MHEWIVLCLPSKKCFKAKIVIMLLWFHIHNTAENKSVQFMQFEELFIIKLVYITLNNIEMEPKCDTKLLP